MKSKRFTLFLKTIQVQLTSYLFFSMVTVQGQKNLG